MEPTVPTTSIIFMYISLFISFAFPILTSIILYRKTHANLMPALYGAIVFVLFCTLHLFFLASLAVSIVYSCLMAKRSFCGFSIVKKRHNSLPFALYYGIGHGGIEAILLVGPAMFNNLLISLTINF